MNRDNAIYIVVEGSTEERFVKDILGPHLLSIGKDVRIHPIIIETGRKGGKKQKGGVSNYHTIKKDIQNKCKEHPHGIVTMMFDLYGFPKEIDGCVWNKSDSIEDVEKMISDSIHYENFVPFLMKYEFETLLFSDTSVFEQNIKKELDLILRKYGNNPENINTNHSPSHRIKESFSKCNKHFSKTTIGVPACSEIGIRKMIDRCPHFAHWLKTIEEKVSKYECGEWDLSKS